MNEAKRQLPLSELVHQPAYGVSESARYLGIEEFTLRGWLERKYFLANNRHAFTAIVVRPSGGQRLSFANLIEAYIVNHLVKEHRVPTSDIRSAIEYADRKLKIRNVLTCGKLNAGASGLFVRVGGDIVNIGRGGQLALPMLDSLLSRIEYEGTIPTKWFPRVGGDDEKNVVLCPYIAFGKPVVRSRGISTGVIAKRFTDGETVTELAEDYDITEKEVEEAVTYERAA